MSHLRFAAILAVGSILTASSAAAPADADKPMYGAFGFDAAGMDKAVNPGDDFYDYANGNWERTTQIPADLAYYDMFQKLQDLSLDRTRTILDAAAARHGSKVGDFYASFMDEASVDAKGVIPIQLWLHGIAAAKDKAALTTVMAALQRQGVKTVFTVAIEQDDKMPERYAARIGQGGLGLPDRDYYLKADPKLAEIRQAYPAYLARLMEMAGEPDTVARAARIAAFETRIAQSHWTRIASRDAERSYNAWSRADFEAGAPGFDWPSYFGKMGVGDEQRFLVSQPDALSGEARAWGETPLTTLKDYLVARVLMAYSPYLTKPFVEANFAFAGTLITGTPENLPRWKRGVSLVSAQMGEAIGKDYIARYFPPEAKIAADRLVRNIIAAYHQRLRTVPWMAPETRAKALEKLASLKAQIGYPDAWRDYSALTIKRDDLVGNVARAEAFEYQRALNHLGRPVDRAEWPFPPMTVNASIVDYGLNEIVFPAAILQPPFFDPNADPAINYGGIGVVIAHELSHHFDDQGSKYDSAGKLANWWTPNDVSRFRDLTGKLVKQYDGYEPIAGRHLQGALTLGENVADVAGLTVAFEAYQISLGTKSAPLIDGFTGNQRFYLGFAQIWRAKFREARLRQKLLTSPHSPGRYRTYEVRNLDSWYKAFAIQPENRLYLPTGERVRIW